MFVLNGACIVLRKSKGCFSPDRMACFSLGYFVLLYPYVIMAAHMIYAFVALGECRERAGILFAGAFVIVAAIQKKNEKSFPGFWES
jgi:hypothetical protein